MAQDNIDFAARIKEVMEEGEQDGAACGWRACTGCHETNEGAETGYFPYSKMFGCYVGSGCHECGGLGVVWEYISASHLDDMIRSLNSPQGEASAT
ncbi:hypothetical protein X740_33525 [Mesorhizobium sp. LNHC221B00]|uniref:hypothetical protein n=1 Tax=Mesorhizobium sp. LNHC221B00 TaxID=1287233 RepID=UPI0003CF025D|nr:hypothetical protein [Mesorhizobium sp. LNHC221B00]ESY72078.1 hypothetical protein X740_33525 [Mesorhizobium sp. LNHC221B00]